MTTMLASNQGSNHMRIDQTPSSPEGTPEGCCCQQAKQACQAGSPLRHSWQRAEQGQLGLSPESSSQCWGSFEGHQHRQRAMMACCPTMTPGAAAW